MAETRWNTTSRIAGPSPAILERLPPPRHQQQRAAQRSFASFRWARGSLASEPREGRQPWEARWRSKQGGDGRRILSYTAAAIFRAKLAPPTSTYGGGRTHLVIKRDKRKNRRASNSESQSELDTRDRNIWCRSTPKSNRR